MNQPLHIQLDLTLPTESQEVLSQFIEGCVCPVMGKPDTGVQKPARLRPHQSPLDIELEDGVQLLVDTRQASKLLRVSARTLFRMYTQKLMPEPIRLTGTSPSWSLAELIAWSKAGCPPQSEWSYPPGRR